jgi:hypothetical protein
MTLTKEDREDMRKRALAATPGPWDVNNGALISVPDGGFLYHPFLGFQIIDAAYIARMDPPSTRALLGALDAAEAERDDMKVLAQRLAAALYHSGITSLEWRWERRHALDAARAAGLEVE